MQTRDELHKLVDSLPDGALEPASRVLTTLQVWPPPPPPGAEEMKKRMEERRREVMQRRKPGTISVFGGSSHYDPKGSGASSFLYWEGDAFVTETVRSHQGHELIVIESIRLEGNHLTYKHEISGPGGKRDEREIVFDVA